MSSRLRSADLVSRGNTSDVWRWSSTTVVKVLRPGIPTEWASLEADITARVHDAGLPCPATEGVLEVEGRPGIVLERIDGPSMWRLMLDDPATVGPLVEQLVALQRRIQDAGPIAGIPALTARLHERIDAAPGLPDGERRAAHDLLRDTPDGSALCHGDMHPANVLMGDGGPVVIDWFDAAIGDPAADLARSSLLMRAPTSADQSNRHLAGATHELLSRLHAAYLSTLRASACIDDGALARWEALMDVARLAEPVPQPDLLSAWRRWREAQAAASR
jgi:aminoglycoside phosphotransferase (APT) family kinase protein